MYKIIFLITFVFGVSRGNPITETTRHGNHNLYILYTRENPREPITLSDNASIVSVGGLFKTNTAIIVHGHGGSAYTTLNPVVKDAFLSSEDVSVIVVDWSTYAEQSYSNAVNAVPNVGVALSEFIQLLLNLNVVALNRLHLVGFDLGAHVVGFTGRNLGGQVARITGLDPSGNQWGSNSLRLRSTDALYVEVIHTDGDGVLSNGVGTALGDVDFFPNGGNNQPGCLTHSCNHNRAWELFAATLTHNHLIGNQCTTAIQLSLNLCRGFALAMGNNDLVKYGSGIYRVNTRRTYPY